MDQKQIKDWSENDVTEYLRTLVETELKAIQDTPNSLVSGDPFKTFENQVELECRERCWGEFITLLEGNFEDLENE